VEVIMTDSQEVIRGEYVSPETKAEFDSLRTVFDTKSALDRLDSYGKWLFASAAVVGSLGAGLSNSAFSKLHGLSAWLFAAAVLSLGICLVQASKSIAPQWVEIRMAELKSMRQAVNSQFGRRQRLLTGASIFFSFALLLAAVSPLASLAPNYPVPILHFSIDEKGTMDAGLEANGLSGGTLIQLRVEATDGAKMQLPIASTSADQNGQAKVSVRMTGIGSASPNLRLVACFQKKGEASCAEQSRVLINGK
jgi:hypothetical protein